MQSHRSLAMPLHCCSDACFSTVRRSALWIFLECLERRPGMTALLEKLTTIQLNPNPIEVTKPPIKLYDIQFFFLLAE